MTWSADELQIQDLEEFELSCTMRVLESAPTTYFAMIQYNGCCSGGYGGVQEDDIGVKKIIFSQWDSKISGEPVEVTQICDGVEGIVSVFKYFLYKIRSKPKNRMLLFV